MFKKTISVFLSISLAILPGAPAFAEDIVVQNGSINNWDSFNVGAGQNTSITVVDADGNPLVDGRAIINVLQNYASQIGGNLDIYGIIAILNANGFNIGADANVNVVGGLILSSLGISQQDFFAGMAALNQASTGPGFIENAGDINVASGSFLALIAGAIKNSGRITAEGGTAILAAGKEASLSLGGDGLISVMITKKIDAEVYDFQGNKIADQIDNSGSITANGGFVKLTARGAEEFFDSMINHSGTISAQSMSFKNGEIYLDGGDEGIVRVTGTLDASGNDAGETGGKVTVLGEKIGLFDEALIDASGDAGGGQVLVGGDYQGKNEAMENALAVYVGEDASIDVSAGRTGNGGKAIVWSDGSTRAYGTINAGGGSESGSGGLIETSGHYLDIDGIRVSTGAENGDTGLWLLDPYNVTISSGATSNGSIAGDVFTPTGNDSILNVDDLVTALSSANIEVTTGGGGAQDGNITIADALTSASAFNLTLTAAGAVTINADVDLGGDFTISGTNVNINNATDVAGVFSITNSGVLNTGANGDITAASFTQSGNGRNQLSGDITTADGNILFNDSVELQGNVAMSTGAGGAGDITFIDDLKGPHNLTLTAGTGNIAFNDGVGGDDFLTGLTINSAAATSFNNADSNIAGSVSITSGNVNLNRTINTTANGSLTVTNSGTLFVDSSADLSLDGAFNQNGTGAVNLGGDITTTNDNITFDGAVTTSGALTLNSGSGAGNITFNSTLTATAGTLDFTAGTGNISASNASNNFQTVDINSANNATLVDTNALTLGTATTSGTLSVTGTTIQLDGNIQTDADVTLTGDVVLGTSVTIDTDSDNVGAGGAVTITGNISGDALDRDLAITTTSGGGNGQVSLNSFGDAGGFYLNNLGITSGNGGVVLNGDISLDDDGAGTAASLTLSGNGNLIVSNNVTIDTEQGNTDGVAGGAVDLGSNAISADAIGFTFTINTGNSDAGETGGAVSFGGGVGNAAGNYLNGGFVVNSDAATDGVITVGSNILTDGGAISLTGDVRVSGDRTFDSEADSGNDAGDITLGGTFSGTVAGAAITIHSLAGGGFAGGDVSLNTFNDAGGAYIRALNIDTDGVGDGTLTLNGDISLDNSGGTAASFSLAGSGNVIISNTLTIDTEQGNSDGVSGGAFDIGSSAISADTAGYTLTINTGNTDAGESGGNITIGGVNNSAGGNYLSGLTLNSDAAASDGVITPGSNIYIDSGTLNIAGSLNIAGDRIFDTEQNNDGNGGAVNFSAGSVSANGADRLLTINTSTTNNGSSGGAVSLGRFNSANGANVGSLSVTTTGGGGGGSGGAVTQTDSLTITTSAAIAAGTGNITLNDASNDFGTVSMTSGNNVNLRDTNSLILGASTVSGTLDVTTSGTITDSGALAVTGITTLTAGGANNITLDNLNNFSTVAITSGNNVTLNDINALNLGASTVSGTLGVTTAGAITDSGAVIVTGDTTLAAGSGNNITLDNLNNFSTAIITSGNNVTLNDINALNLGASTVSGTFDLTTGGDITISGVQVVSGTTTITAGAGNDITLNNASNEFSTVRIVSGRNVDVSDLNDIILGASTISGTFQVLAGGTISDSGNLSVTGTTTLATGGISDDITLDNANDFSAVVINTGNNVTLNDTNGLILGASTIDGTLGVTTAGAITQSGALSVTGTTTLAAGSGNNITLDNAANAFSTVGITSGNNVNLRDANALALAASTVSGTLDVTTSGAVTQSGALAVTGTTTVAAGTANNVTLNNASNNFGTIAVTSANNISIRDANSLGVNATSANGTLDLTASTIQLNGNLQSDGDMTLTGDVVLGASVSLDTESGDDSAAGDLTVTGAVSGNAAGRDLSVDVTGGTSGGAISLNSFSNGGGNYVNDVQLTLDDSALTLNGNILLDDSGSGDASSFVVDGGAGIIISDNVTIDTEQGNTDGVAGGAVDFGDLVIAADAVGYTFTINTSNSNAGETGGAVTYGSVDNAIGGSYLSSFVVNADGDTDGIIHQSIMALSVDGGLLSLTGNLRLTENLNFDTEQGNNGSAGAVILSGSVSGDVAGRDITIDTSTSNVGSNAGNITLSNFNSANGAALDDVTLTATSGTGGTGGSVSFADAIDIGGALSVNTRGAITDSAALTVAGITTLQAGSANNITLDNANNFGTVRVISGNNVIINDTNGVILSTSTISGNYDVTAAGTITQTALFTVAGTMTLAAGSGNDITLNTAGNDFGTVAITSGNNVTLRDTNALNLGASTVSGTLTLNTGGAVTDSGALAVTGTTTLAAGAGNDITLDNLNNFSTVGITSGNNVTLNDTNALNLAASTVSGALNVTTSGAVTDSGALAITGTTTIAAGSTNNITLDNLNNFSTIGITSGNDVTLNDINSLILGPSTISGTLTITTGGAITDSGALTVTGTTTLAAGAGNDITLDNLNNFSTVGITSGNNVTLNDINALNLAASTVSGALNVSTGGALTDSGALAVTGTTTLTAGSENNITLDNLNDFSTVGITSGNNVTLNDINALILGASNVSGTLTVTTGGALTDSGALTVAGTTTLAAGAGNNITLDNVNDFSTLGITSGNNVILNDTNDLNLAASTVSGTLTITTGGDLTQSGALAVTGTTTLDAGDDDIIFDNDANDFIGAVTAEGDDITLHDANAIDLEEITAAGSVEITAGDAITNGSGAGVNITAGDDSSLTAGSTIGTLAEPLDVEIDGALTVSADGQAGGNAAVITGNAVTITAPNGSAPVLFNGNDVTADPPPSGPVITPESQTAFSQEINNAMSSSDDSGNDSDVDLGSAGSGSSGNQSDAIDTSSLDEIRMALESITFDSDDSEDEE